MHAADYAWSGIAHDCMAHGMENTDGFEFPRSVLGAGSIAGYCLG